MAKIVYAWELGGGLGHIGPFHGIATELSKLGHELTLVLRDLSRVSSLYQTLDFRLLQAPIKMRPVADTFSQPKSLPQVLHNLGFGNFDSLFGLVRAWRTIFEISQPDIVIVDHAPGALIALQGMTIPVASLGIGFANPPSTYPMASLDNAGTDPDTLLTAEHSLLENVNRVLAANRQPLLAHLGELFDHPQCFLLTFNELDPYRNRANANHVGAWPYSPDHLEMPDWPAGNGPRVFAYLKRSTGLGHLLDWLAKQELPSLVVCDSMEIAPLRQIAKPSLQFYDRPLPIDVAARQCDLAILNATHSTTCSMLLAGKPILQIPHHLEQAVTAQRTMDLQAGTIANKDDGHQIVWQLTQMIQDPGFAVGASKFAETYRNYRPAETAIAVARQIHQLATS